MTGETPVCSAPDTLPVQALFQASRRREVMEALREFYVDTDDRIATQRATCWNRGDCCRFAAFGHRLYVTALEVCYYLGKGGRPPAVTGDACPHALGGMCHIRDSRPLGCRIFHCGPKDQGWQAPLTEELLARLRTLHGKLGVPYFYADWPAVLRAIHDSASSGV